MKRPQSAKPGHKGYWGQSSADDINDHSMIKQSNNRKAVKFVRPDLTTHDFARILPKRIQQDKERLYSEALHLKQNLNEIMEENIRLKTKITILQKEKDKMNKYLETTPDGLGNKGNSRINIYGNKPADKDNMIVRNLKKIVRQMREENQMLRIQNQKIKKMMKYTRINEIEIEKKVVIEENKRMSALLEEYSNQLVNQEDVEKENQELKKYLEEEMEQNKQLAEENQKYEEIVDNLEEKIKVETQKFQNKEKKLLRDMALEKRKTLEDQKHIQDLRRQLRMLRENQSISDINKKKPGRTIVRPQTNTSTRIQKVNTQQSNTSKDMPLYTDNYAESRVIKQKNEQLEKELKQIKLKLQKSQLELVKLSVKEKSEYEIPKIRKIDKEQTPRKDQIHESHGKASHVSGIDKSQVFHKEEDSYEENYEEDHDYKQQFEHEEDIKASRKEKQDLDQIEKYKKDFEENQQEEQLFKKESNHKKKKVEEKDKKDKKKKKTNEKQQIYKPDKKILAEIKELLTYRMKSQRYPFNDLKSDIESAENSSFAFEDLCHMLVSEPFYLTSQYTKAFLCYCFQMENPGAGQSLQNQQLISKLRKVIDDFQLMPQLQQKQMIVRIAQMTSTYPNELQVAFQNIKNGEETVSKKDLIQMFQKLELEDKYIDLIIAELSLCSDDLEHLNFHGFFQRFYIEEDEYQDDNAIEEQGQESEQSYKNSSRVKKQSHIKASNKELPKDKHSSPHIDDEEQINEDDEHD